MSKTPTQQEEDEFVKEFMERAKYDLLYVVTRLLEITARYFQFRVRDVVARGLTFTHTYNIRYEDNRVILTLEVEVPQELIDKYAKRYGEMAKIVRRIMRHGRVTDRYKTRSREFEDLEGVEIDVESTS